MATRIHTTNFLQHPMDGESVVWSGLLNGDSGDAISGDYVTSFFQVSGTFGTLGSVQMEGSNDGNTWQVLSAAALLTAGFFASFGANERPKFLRPRVTAGDGSTNLTVWGFLKKLRPGVV